MKSMALVFCLIACLTVQAQVVNVDSLLDQTHPYDSALLKPHQQLDSLQSLFYHQSEDLKVSCKNRLNELDLTGQQLQTKIDSLSALNLPTNYHMQKLDSINKAKGSAIASLNQKMESLKSKTSTQLKEINLPPELNEKLSAVTQDINGFQLPVKDLNIPPVDMPENGLSNLDALNTSIKTPLGEFGKIDGLGNLNENLGDVSSVTGDLGHYQQDLQNLSKGNLNEVEALPKGLENKAADLTGMKDIQQQASGAFDPLKEVSDQMQNPETMKEAAVQKVQEVAVNHFAGKEAVLQQAMDKIAKYKQKYSSVNSLSDITKKRPNEMHGKPLIERLVPGINFQILKSGNNILVDFNPYVGYRFTGRITAGGGWNQRVSFDHPSRITRVFGPRMFGEYRLSKGFSPRIEIETMSTLIPLRFSSANSDPYERVWVWTYFAGIKKEYRFFKMIKGTAQVMINLYDPYHKSPYGDKVITRFGFEFPIKKKPKQ